MNGKELQIKLGNATEKLISKKLRSFGYWNYILPKKAEGQPCDIVAMKGLDTKNGKIEIAAWMIDAKHVEGKVSFTFDRIEPNQVSSLGYARDFALIQGYRGHTGFVIFFERDKQLRWFSFDDYEKFAKDGVKSVNMTDLRLFEEVLADANNNY